MFHVLLDIVWSCLTLMGGVYIITLFAKRLWQLLPLLFAFVTLWCMFGLAHARPL